MQNFLLCSLTLLIAISTKSVAADAPETHYKSISASGTVDEAKYGPELVADRFISSAWCAKDKGSEIVLTFKEPIKVAKVCFNNGYQKSPEVYGDNSKVKELEISIQDRSKAEKFKKAFKVSEIRSDWQAVGSEDCFETKKYFMNPESAAIKIKILQFQRGKKSQDICISGISVNDTVNSVEAYGFSTVEGVQPVTDENKLQTLKSRYLSSLQLRTDPADSSLWEVFTRVAIQKNDREIARQIFTASKKTDGAAAERFDAYAEQLFKGNPGLFVETADEFFSGNFDTPLTWLIGPAAQMTHDQLRTIIAQAQSKLKEDVKKRFLDAVSAYDLNKH